MATRYWRGGSGNWDASSTTNWSTTSGGAGGASVPTSADDVIFDANSGSGNYTVTLGTSGTRSCLSLTVSNPTGGTVSFSSNNSLQIYGDVDIQAGNFNSFSGLMYLNAFSGGVGTTVDVSIIPSITTAGSVVVFSGDSDTSTFNVISDLSIRYIALTRGVVNFGSYTHTVTFFANDLFGLVTTSNLTINLDSCTLNTPSFEVYGATTTFNAGTSSVVATSNSSLIGRVGDLAITLYDYTLNYAGSSNGTANIYPPVTFNSLTVNVTAASRQVIQFYNDCTIGTLSVTGQLVGQFRPFIKSAPQGTARTLTVTTATTVDYADFQDITIAGGASPISGTMLGDCGGNTGITFPAPKTVYWNLPAGGAWTSTAWATTSGGAVADTNFPLPQDTAIIEDTGLNSSATISMGGGNIGSIDWSTRTLNASFTGFTGLPYIYGDIIGTSLTGTSLPDLPSCVISGGRAQTISGTRPYSAGGVIDGSCTVDKSPSAVLQFASDVGVDGSVSFNGGTLDLAGYTLTCDGFFTHNGTGQTLDGNSGIINVQDDGIVFRGSSITIPSTVTLNITRASISDRQLISGFASPNFNVNISPTSASAGRIDLTTGSFSCNNLTFGNNFSGAFRLESTLNLTGSFSFSNNASATIGSTTTSIRTINVNPPTATTVTFDPKGKTLSFISLTITGADITSEVDLSSSLTLGRDFRVASGTFRSNSNAITCRSFNCGNSSGGLSRSVDIGTSLVSFGSGVTSGPTTTFDMRDPNSTLTFAYTSGAELRSIATTSVTIFEGGDETYPTLTIAGTSNILELRGNNSFENIKNTVQPVGLRVTSGTNQTVSKFELSGTAGNLVTLDSSTTAQHTLTCPTGLDISVNYLNISYSNAVGSIISTQWYAGANSVDSGNNTGWQFVNPPPPPKGEFFMIMLG